MALSKKGCLSGGPRQTRSQLPCPALWATLNVFGGVQEVRDLRFRVWCATGSRLHANRQAVGCSRACRIRSIIPVLSVLQAAYNTFRREFVAARYVILRTRSSSSIQEAVQRLQTCCSETGNTGLFWFVDSEGAERQRKTQGLIGSDSAMACQESRHHAHGLSEAGGATSGPDDACVLLPIGWGIVVGIA